MKQLGIFEDFIFDIGEFDIPDFDVGDFQITDFDFSGQLSNFDFSDQISNFDFSDQPTDFDYTGEDMSYPDFEGYGDSYDDFNGEDFTIDPSQFQIEPFDFEEPIDGANMVKIPAPSSAPSPAPTPASSSLQDYLKAGTQIATTAAQIWLTKEQAEAAASRLNQQTGASATRPRYVTQLDPVTGKARVVDTLTGQAVTEQSGGFLDQAADFVRANAFPIAVVGAILFVALMRERRFRKEKR
jgi:hypothetical protein